MALDFAAGCLGGCAGVIVGHPLDTIKVHMQTQDARNPKYRGALHCMRVLVGKNGIRGLYRGMTSPLTGVAGINAIVFGVYGNTQRRFRDPDALRSHFLAGMAAGTGQSFFCSPVELAKTRVQMSGDKKGPMQCLRDIYRVEGTKGVFKGLSMTILREGPSFGVYFMVYEFLTRTENEAPVSTSVMLVAGGFAGVASWLVSYPADVLKTRMQMDGVNGRNIYKNSWHCLQVGISKEGYGFLVRGLTPALIRAFPVNAAIFTTVTWTMRLLGDYTHDEDIPNVTLLDRFNDALNILNLNSAPA